MKKLLLKILGVDPDYLDQIKKYNQSKQREADIREFFICEEKITQLLNLHHNDLLHLIRNYTREGFPVEQYRDLSSKLKAYDLDVYDALVLEKNHDVKNGAANARFRKVSDARLRWLVDILMCALVDLTKQKSDSSDLQHKIEVLPTAKLSSGERGWHTEELISKRRVLQLITERNQ